MSQPHTPATPLPRFERPSQAVVFWSLENLCAANDGHCELSLRELSRHCGLSLNTTHRGVRDLVRLDVIRYQPGRNQSQPSRFELAGEGQRNTMDKLATGSSASPVDSASRQERGKSGWVKLRDASSAVARIAVPLPSDSDHDTSRDTYLNDIDGGAVHSKKRDSDPLEQDRLAERIAASLGDSKNIALYKSYCRRYPTPIILKAYIRSKETPADKIKKSRGALFNFLVTLHAKRNDN